MTDLKIQNQAILKNVAACEILLRFSTKEILWSLPNIRILRRFSTNI